MPAAAAPAAPAADCAAPPGQRCRRRRGGREAAARRCSPTPAAPWRPRPNRPQAVAPRQGRALAQRQPRRQLELQRRILRAVDRFVKLRQRNPRRHRVAGRQRTQQVGFGLAPQLLRRADPCRASPAASACRRAGRASAPAAPAAGEAATPPSRRRLPPLLRRSRRRAPPARSCGHRRARRRARAPLPSGRPVRAPCALPSAATSRVRGSPGRRLHAARADCDRPSGAGPRRRPPTCARACSAA